MAVELPISPLSDIGLGGGSFVLGDHSKRAHWANSFFLPPNQNVGSILLGGCGAVTSNSGATVTLSIGGAGGTVGVQAGGQYAGTTTGIQQIYVADLSTPSVGGGPNGYAISVSSPFVSFPVGCLPLAVLIMDSIGRIQQILDMRPSYLTAAPDLGTGMTESVADATRRVFFQNNYAVPRTYALTPQIPPDLSLPNSGFVLGGGSVVLSGTVVSTPSTYISTTTKVNNPNPIYAFAGALTQAGITQGYIDPTTGALTTRQTQTSGIFPNGSLPLFEATTNAGLIRSLVDWRPSYI